MTKPYNSPESSSRLFSLAACLVPQLSPLLTRRPTPLLSRRSSRRLIPNNSPESPSPKSLPLLSPPLLSSRRSHRLSSAARRNQAAEWLRQMDKVAWASLFKEPPEEDFFLALPNGHTEDLAPVIVLETLPIDALRKK